jgi:hypothetical protein
VSRYLTKSTGQSSPRGIAACTEKSSAWGGSMSATVLFVRQEKTGAVVNVPILPPLQAAIDALPAGQLTFLVSANSYTRLMASAIGSESAAA